MSDIIDLIDKIGEREEAITEHEFISPVFFNTHVATHINGLVYDFKIPSSKPGWYKYRPVDIKRAKMVSEADPIEIDSYMKHLDRLRMVLVYKDKGVYYGVPMKENKYGMPLHNLLPVYLCDDQVMDFDRVCCRYDGLSLWYEAPDIANDPSKAEYLRDQLSKYAESVKLRYPGLNVEERHAYAFRYQVDKKLVQDRKKKKIKEDVEHAGGKFVNFMEGRDFFNVTYEVDGSQYTSTISKKPGHQVITAGVCLSGGDRDFDLKSLITVMRERQEGGH